MEGLGDCVAAEDQEESASVQKIEVTQQLGRPGSIQALLLPSSGMSARHRKGVTADWLSFIFRRPKTRFATTVTGIGTHLFCINGVQIGKRPGTVEKSLGNLGVSQPSCFLRVAWQLSTGRVLQGEPGDRVPVATFTLMNVTVCKFRHQTYVQFLLFMHAYIVGASHWVGGCNTLSVSICHSTRRKYEDCDTARLVSPREKLIWRGRVRGSNPTTASRLSLSRLGQPGSIPALVQSSGGTAVRHRKGAIAELFFRLIAIFVRDNWKTNNRKEIPPVNVRETRANEYQSPQDRGHHTFVIRLLSRHNPLGGSYSPGTTTLHHTVYERSANRSIKLVRQLNVLLIIIITIIIIVQL
ncbi:hypothetical protein T265_05640 [Opisthorchis viverrini]|uniref:Uncharacterized protein n=1 Tax=Opisthorchis viverrini TaxID=6198 RepID=A0A074ZVC7_OPIVI|nr:hypothetical protein T265_05640 [Opisthorchis viverrini]KER27320.1 hypothetical protein T265_05640 [Opisthorchis viverrini]